MRHQTEYIENQAKIINFRLQFISSGRTQPIRLLCEGMGGICQIQIGIYYTAIGKNIEKTISAYPAQSAIFLLFPFFS